MQKVTGIGGFFFRSQDPTSLAQWYKDHLGVALVPSDYETPPWLQAAGPTAFAPFEENSDYFGRPEQQWMLNFRVDDLEAMITQLQSAGIATEPEGDFPNGKFARLRDPEGNPIQLWQPA